MSDTLNGRVCATRVNSHIGWVQLHVDCVSQREFGRDLFGQGGEAKHFINNHLRFTILYHKDIETDLARIVGFEVQPTSVHHEYKEWDAVNPVLETCSEARHPLDAGASLPPQLLEVGGEVVFTYDVFFKVRLHFALSFATVSLHPPSSPKGREKF